MKGRHFLMQVIVAYKGGDEWWRAINGNRTCLSGERKGVKKELQGQTSQLTQNYVNETARRLLFIALFYVQRGGC
jgi:hypothetical protein